jgi:hypothetical protein
MGTSRLGGYRSSRGAQRRPQQVRPVGARSWVSVADGVTVPRALARPAVEAAGDRGEIPKPSAPTCRPTADTPDSTPRSINCQAPPRRYDGHGRIRASGPQPRATARGHEACREGGSGLARHLQPGAYSRIEHVWRLGVKFEPVTCRRVLPFALSGVPERPLDRGAHQPVPVCIRSGLRAPLYR